MLLKVQKFLRYSSAFVCGILLLLSSGPTLSIEANSSYSSEQFEGVYQKPLSHQAMANENELPPSLRPLDDGQQKIYPQKTKTPPSNFSDGLSQTEHYETQPPSSASTPEITSNLNDPSSSQNTNSFEQNEIIDAGHSFFGTITTGLANGIEYLFQSQGKPNAYILGEDASGAFLLGLRYGEGNMHLKNYPSEKIFWQGPTIGYDAGAEGSKTMILVYNLEDPSQIYDRYSGVQGAAYFIGGVSIQLQKHGNVTLAIIRSGIGLRLGANVGYSNYTRTPTWNPL